MPVHLRDRRGIIVLGPLIAFVCILVIMVVAGKLIYPTPRGIYAPPPRPRLHVAVSAADLFTGGREVRSLRAGERVWVERLDNGSAVVFRDASGREVLGITDALLVPEGEGVAPLLRNTQLPTVADPVHGRAGPEGPGRLH
jgi:hypothetical protein